MGFGKANQVKQEISESSEEGEGGNSPLEVNSMVQITLDKGNQVSGIIRWVGYLPQIKEKMAGIELVRLESWERTWECWWQWLNMEGGILGSPGKGY